MLEPFNGTRWSGEKMCVVLVQVSNVQNLGGDGFFSEGGILCREGLCVCLMGVSWSEWARRGGRKRRERGEEIGEERGEKTE